MTRDLKSEMRELIAEHGLEAVLDQLLATTHRLSKEDRQKALALHYAYIQLMAIAMEIKDEQGQH